MRYHEESFEEDHYFDDIDDYAAPQRPKFPLKVKLALLTIASVFGYSMLGSTFAANVRLSSGVVEYGQGILQATACDPSLTITPYATFANASNSGSYKLTTIQVSGLDTGCYGKDLLIRAYDSSTATPLTLYQTGGSTNYDSIRVYDANGSFSLAGSGLTYSEITNITGGFRVTLFNSASPAAAAISLATSVYKFTLETLDHDTNLSQTSLPSGSLTFNGSTTDISYGSNSAFTLGTGDFTVDVLANIGTAQNQTFYDAGGDVNSAGGFAFWIESGYIKIRRNGVGSDITYAMQGSWANSWHHYAAVRGNSKFRIYVDGTMVVEAVDSGYTITRDAPVVGQLNQYRSNYVLNGSLRNLRVVKGTALYSSNVTSPTSPLAKVPGTILLLLAQNQSNPTYDSSDNHWVPLVSSTLPAYVAP